MGVITFTPPIPTNRPDINVGPDGRQYPFGWLGEEVRIGRFIIVESRRDQDAIDPESYVVYEIQANPLREVVRSTLSWRSLSEVLIAIVMIEEGVNENTIMHTVPFVLGGIRSQGNE